MTKPHQGSMRVYDEHPTPPPLHGSRHWNDLPGWEQDEYLLACFQGEKARSAVERRLDIFDRIALSIQYHLLGPYFEDADSGERYEPGSAEEAKRVLVLRTLALEDCPLGQRLLQATVRRQMVAESGIPPQKLVYDNDARLTFMHLHPLKPQRGWEALDDASFGGVYPDPPRPRSRPIGSHSPSAPALAAPSRRSEPANIGAKLMWVVAAMLLWALLPFNPYGYYILLRFVVGIYFLWLGWVAWDSGLRRWTPALWVVTVLYNPIARFSLSRGTWGIINIATVVLLFVFVWRFSVARSDS